MIIQIISAFVGTLLFALMFNISKKELIYCGLIGAFGWAIYLSVIDLTSSAPTAAIIATLIISTTSQILARIRKNPVTIYQISGIIPLVPGVGMYNTLQQFVIKEYDSAILYFSDTMQVASAIAVGLLLVTSTNKVLRKRNKKVESH